MKYKSLISMTVTCFYQSFIYWTVNCPDVLRGKNIPDHYLPHLPRMPLWLTLSIKNLNFSNKTFKFDMKFKRFQFAAFLIMSQSCRTRKSKMIFPQRLTYKSRYPSYFYIKIYKFQPCNGFNDSFPAYIW